MGYFAVSAVYTISKQLYRHLEFYFEQNYSQNTGNTIVAKYRSGKKEDVVLCKY